MSEHAYNDPAIRSKLEPKGELVIAKPGAVIKLETSSLRLQARVVDVTYGTGPLPPNSYFDKMTIEIQAWRNSGASAPAPAAPMAVPAATVPTYAPPPMPSAQPTFTPPPAMPTYTPPPATSSPFAPPTTPSSPASAPPSFGGGTPFKPNVPTPPPAPTRPIVDDDPFGGTGDFTPVN